MSHSGPAVVRATARPTATELTMATRMTISRPNRCAISPLNMLAGTPIRPTKVASQVTGMKKPPNC